MTAPAEEINQLLDISWKQYAACAGYDTSIFFDGDTNPKQLCSHCPVRSDCLNYALLTEQSGTWGGTTEAERRVKYNNNFRNALREDYGY